MKLLREKEEKLSMFATVIADWAASGRRAEEVKCPCTREVSSSFESMYNYDENNDPDEDPPPRLEHSVTIDNDRCFNIHAPIQCYNLKGNRSGRASDCRWKGGTTSSICNLQLHC